MQTHCQEKLSSRNSTEKRLLKVLLGHEKLPSFKRKLKQQTLLLNNLLIYFLLHVKGGSRMYTLMANEQKPG